MKTVKLFSIAILLLFFGCSKDETPGPNGQQGVAGVHGEKGEEGPQGEKGDTGDTGPQGEKGTANVIYSPWMNFNWNSVNNALFKEMKVNIPEITEEFIEKGGTVLVYTKLSQNGIIVMQQLPYTNSNDFLSFLTAIVPGGFIPNFERGTLVSVKSLDGIKAVGTYKDVPGGTNYDIRYILIPGGAEAYTEYAQETMKIGEIKYDYESLKQMYNIPD